MSPPALEHGPRIGTLTRTACPKDHVNKAHRSLRSLKCGRAEDDRSCPPPVVNFTSTHGGLKKHGHNRRVQTLYFIFKGPMTSFNLNLLFSSTFTNPQMLSTAYVKLYLNFV